MIRSLMSSIDWLDLAFAAAVIIAAGVYWWARKAAKHPEYATRKEQALDERIAAALRAAGVNEETIAKVVGVDLVAKGQQLYAETDALAEQLEIKARQLLAHAKVLRQR